MRAGVKITTRERRDAAVRGKNAYFFSLPAVSHLSCVVWFHARSRFARSTIPEEVWGPLVVYRVGRTARHRGLATKPTQRYDGLRTANLGVFNLTGCHATMTLHARNLIRAYFVLLLYAYYVRRSIARKFQHVHVTKLNAACCNVWTSQRSWSYLFATLPCD